MSYLVLLLLEFEVVVFDWKWLVEGSFFVVLLIINFIIKFVGRRRYR